MGAFDAAADDQGGRVTTYSTAAIPDADRATLVFEVHERDPRRGGRAMPVRDDPIDCNYLPVYALAVAVLSDGTAVIVGGGQDCMVHVWRVADGEPIGEPSSHSDYVNAVAVAELPDGTPIIVSGGYDGTRIWRLGNGDPVMPPLSTPTSRIAVAGESLVMLHGDDIALHQVTTMESRTTVSVPSDELARAIWRHDPGGSVN